MYLTFADYYIDISSKKTKNEMSNLLNKCNTGHIILGDETEYENGYYTIVVHLDSNKKDLFGIGIISEGHGLIPHILLNSSKKKLFIGFNSETVIVDCMKKIVDFRISLNSLFYQFLYLNNPRIILVLHEIGLVALTEEGREIWKYDGDIIQSYKIEEGNIFLEFLDNEPVKLSLLNGKTLN
jgi:hypothetical protein